MKFLLLDQSAAHELVADRVLQSRAFDQGVQLASGLKTGAFASSISQRLHFVAQREGIYLLTEKPSENAVVIDLVQSQLFTHLEEDNCLCVLQRVARFALKLWHNLRLSVCEHVSVETKKAVLFPFPLTSHSSFRVVLEREPQLTKAVDIRGQVLLVFGAGTSDKLGAGVVPDTRIAVNALEGLASARGEVSRKTSQNPASTDQVVKVTQLDTRDGRSIASLSFSQWLQRLTTAQRAFVMRPLAGPERIDGPAGTGKTLCLVLKCLNLLRAAKTGVEHHAVFIAHSEATRRAIASTFAALDEDQVLVGTRRSSAVSLTITTLHEWSATLLGERLSETELLDRDAMGSKELQLLHVLEAYQNAKTSDLPSHRKLLSGDFTSFLDTEDDWRVAEMLRHEIGITIKGRAGENWERYRQLEGIRYNLPLRSDSDRGFVFSVFSRYKERLEKTSQFDTDDVVLTALGQLDTPLWRRRRARDGFDSVFIDETHLFNLNELSLFHHLTRKEGSHPIAFSVDRAQAVGDRSLTDETIGQAIADGTSAVTGATRMTTVFRCSPAILNVAQAVTASGATLFTNFFDDPLQNVGCAFTAEEEAKSAPPRYIPVPGASFESEAFVHAERLAQGLSCLRSSIAIVCFSDELYKNIVRHAKECRKPILSLERRGDLEVVDRARKGNLFLLSAPEYVGGLEFDGVVLVGVDEFHVPPIGPNATAESRHFLEYAAHNLLYVALTRARYGVVMLGDSASKPSKLLASAIRDNLVTVDPRNE